MPVASGAWLCTIVLGEIEPHYKSSLFSWEEGDEFGRIGSNSAQLLDKCYVGQEKRCSSLLCLLLRTLSFVVRSGGLEPATVIGNVLENLWFKALKDLSLTRSEGTQDEPFLNVERTFLLYYLGVIFIIKNKEPHWKLTAKLLWFPFKRSHFYHQLIGAIYVTLATGKLKDKMKHKLSEGLP